MVFGGGLSLIRIIKGNHYWNKVFRRISQDSPIMVLPKIENETELNTLLKYLIMYANAHPNQHITTIVDKTYDLQVFNEISSVPNINSINVTERVLKCLLDRYMIAPFEKPIIIMSLDKPSIRIGRDIIGIMGITLDDLVANGLFRSKWW